MSEQSKYVTDAVAVNRHLDAMSCPENTEKRCGRVH